MLGGAWYFSTHINFEPTIIGLKGVVQVGKSPMLSTNANFHGPFISNNLEWTNSGSLKPTLVITKPI